MTAKICSFLKSLISDCLGTEQLPPTSHALVVKSQEIITTAAKKPIAPPKREKLEISLVPVAKDKKYFAKISEIQATMAAIRENAITIGPKVVKSSTLSQTKVFRDDIEMPDWTVCTKEHVTSYTSPKASAILKALPVNGLDHFNSLIGSDLNCVDILNLRNSKLGRFLHGFNFEIIRPLSTTGSNSYCFEISHASVSQFLKIFKPRAWDYPSLKSCIYSKNHGVGCLVNNAQGLTSIVIPDHVIGMNSKGKLTTECIEGDLILATISPMIEKENLKSLMERETLDPQSVFKLMINILEAVASFKRHKITHRDLTPVNILVDPMTLAVEIIDFDHATTQICKPLDGAYAAKESSSKMDEFTLGLVFLELHLGRNPYDRVNVRDSVYNGTIPFLKNETLIDLVIKGLLYGDPELRWTVFEALACLQKRTLL